MKPDHLNNLSQESRSCQDSNSENNSHNSDSEKESGAVQELRKTRKGNEKKVIDLERKLAEVEINLKAQKEKNSLLEMNIKDKDDFIKTLQMSIDLLNQTKELSIQKMQTQIVNLQNALGLSKSKSLINDTDSNDQHGKEVDDLNAEFKKLHEENDKLVKLDEKAQKYDNNLREKEDQIARLEFQIDESKLKIVKLECKLKEKDDKLVEMEKNLTKYTQDAGNTSESHVFLNFTKDPSFKLVTLPDYEPFAAVFEDVPSAGPDWLVIQRRIDGSFDTSIKNNFNKGCGELSGEFWIGGEKLHKLTTSRRHELYIILVDFDDVTAFARYDHFVVGSEKEDYKLLSLGEYSGNAGDALRSHINQAPFNEKVFGFGNGFYGWWGINNCNLNGKYLGSKIVLEDWNGIWWGRWNMGKRYSLKSCKMLIRPKP
ncbi:fibrinogen-like protein 1 [Drosophila rhopaloa]|uniref:Fibrinogen-like protein 1 n=1 Tax=Drosophila rhopaloa TaxID=1041015 RepID=A0A6P4EAK8_DRORH|nr:fibrinogen-like protein 1 [Drosophila rhopaloa]